MKWIVRVITAAVLYAASVQTAQACWGELTCEKTADTGEITSYPAIVKAFVLTAVGVVCLAAALIGFASTPLVPWQRGLLVAAAILLVFPTGGMEIFGVVLALGTFLVARRGAR